MSSEDDHIEFSGNTSSEPFIRAVKRRAFAEGKQRDPNWMADFASLCFSGPALRWYTNLDSRTREDWERLQEALLVEYPVVEHPAEQPSSSGIQFAPGQGHPLMPVPAAAPTPGPSIPNNMVGRIRVICDNHSIGNYISRELHYENGVCIVCQSEEDALLVELDQSRWPCMLRMLNSSHDFKWLGGAMYSHTALGPGSIAYAGLAAVKEPGLNGKRSSYKFGKGSIKAAIWDYSPMDGTLRVIWEDSDVTYILAACTNTETKRIRIVPCLSAFSRALTAYPHYRLRLVFERS